MCPRSESPERISILYPMRTRNALQSSYKAKRRQSPRVSSWREGFAAVGRSASPFTHQDTLSLELWIRYVKRPCFPRDMARTTYDEAATLNPEPSRKAYA